MQTIELRGRVQIVNPITKRFLRRKDAEHYVSQGRAEEVDANQIRLIMSHPANRTAAAGAASGYQTGLNRVASIAELRHVPFAGDVGPMFIRRQS